MLYSTVHFDTDLPSSATILDTSPDSLTTNNMLPYNETGGKGLEQPATQSSKPPTTTAKSVLHAQSKPSASSMLTSNMAQSTAGSNSTPDPSPQASQKVVLPPGSKASSSESQRGGLSSADQKNSRHASGRCSLNRSPSPTAIEPTKSPTPPSSSRTRRPPTPASSPLRETATQSAELTSARKPAQSLDSYDRSIIAATATLAYFQSKCGEGNSPLDYNDNSCATKVKALTKIAKGLLRFPGETIAISADIFQKSIRLTVAHDSGNSLHCDLDEQGISGPEK